jgi:magnesium transporter
MGVEKMKEKKVNYPLESAGSRMVANVPTVFPEEKISDLCQHLFKSGPDFETLNYIYVIDKEKKLVGVLSLKSVFQNKNEKKVKELMEEEIVRVGPYVDQERVAILALKHNIKAIPVSDKKGLFLGVVPSDVILDILHTEDVEDILRFAGVSKSSNFADKIFKASPNVLIKLRLPWLALGLLGGLLAAQIIAFFERPLQDHFILATFIPLIVYMADAVGTQTQTLFIRSLVYRINIKEYFLKEIKVSFFIATILGTGLALISYLWFKIYYISVILGLSLFFTVIAAFALGLFIPYFFNKIEKDPAIASGPVGTIIRDILSLLFYFAVASIMLYLFSV